MGNNRKLQFAVHAALAAAAASAMAPTAFAQTTAANTATSTELQEVIVTGSRIAQAPNDISMSPITTVTADQIATTGLTRVEDVLNNLPSITADQNAGNSISAVGTATVSLYGLGASRTLALVNGRRLQPGGAGGLPPGEASAADINQIPVDLIKSVDVLTGGASAVYGADAVAGVVNFILDTHYEGVKVDGSYGYYNHSNNSQQYLGYLADANATAPGSAPPPQSTVNSGQTKDVSIVAGSNFADGKGNATTYFTYTNTLPAVGYQYDHAGCTLVAAADGKTPICGGSSISGHGNFFALGSVGGVTTTLYAKSVDPKTGAFRDNSHADDYNYGALSYFLRSSERYTAGAFLHYDINDHVEVYTETMYARNTSRAQYGPSGNFASQGSSPMSCSDPLFTAQEKSIMCSPANIAANQAVYGLTGDMISVYTLRRNVEGGGRQDNYTSDSIRQVIGLKGQINDAWSYDAYAQLGISQLSDIEANFLNTQRINNALDVITDPKTGQPACRVTVNGSDPACVPWNIWVPGGVTPAALAYLTTPASYTATSTEYIVEGSTTGDLGKYGIKLPTAEDGVTINVGADYRQEKFVFDPDYIFSNGYQAGGAAAEAVNGQFHVWEGYTELHVPIMDKLPGAYNLSFDTGYRYSSYTLGGNTNTYKFQLEYAPVQDIRFRGGYNRAVRAPSLGELFQPAAVGAGGSGDPCWGPTPTFTLEQCEKTGVTANQYGHITVNNSGQTNTIQGGNSQLTPEIADTYTLGFVLQPTFIPRLVMSVDAFNIKIKNTIEELSSTTIINTCANQGNLCDLIHRGPTGSLWFNNTNYVVATQQNIGSVMTRGADMSIRYDFPVGDLGKIQLGIQSTYVKDFETEPLPGGGQYDCAGYAGNTCGSPVPHWRSVQQATWQTPWYGVDFTFRWRFVGPNQMEGLSQNPQLAASGFYPGQAQIPGYNYIDLSASANPWSTLTVRMGVNNIADKDPPLVLGGAAGCNANQCNGNSWTGTYDMLGRYLYVNVGMKF
jgi:iron complex outermembrane recepter protein